MLNDTRRSGVEQRSPAQGLWRSVCDVRREARQSKVKHLARMSAFEAIPRLTTRPCNGCIMLLRLGLHLVVGRVASWWRNVSPTYPLEALLSRAYVREL